MADQPSLTSPLDSYAGPSGCVRPLRGQPKATMPSSHAQNNSQKRPHSNSDDEDNSMQKATQTKTKAQGKKEATSHPGSEMDSHVDESSSCDDDDDIQIVDNKCISDFHVSRLFTNKIYYRNMLVVTVAIARTSAMPMLILCSS
jgi:hypothetical protein